MSDTDHHKLNAALYSEANEVVTMFPGIELDSTGRLNITSRNTEKFLDMQQQRLDELQTRFNEEIIKMEVILQRMRKSFYGNGRLVKSK